VADETFGFDRPFDVHEKVAVHGEQIRNINYTLEHISEVLDKQTVSIQAMSEAIVKLANTQEIMQQLYTDSKVLREDLTETQVKQEVMGERAKAVPKLEREVTELSLLVQAIKTRQTQNNVVIGAIAASGTLIATGVVNYFFKIFGGGG